MSNKKHLTYLLSTIAAVFILNTVLSKVSIRKDLTKDKRYSVSNTSKEIVSKITSDIDISIYLTGDIPVDFEVLKKETQYYLEELKDINSFVNFHFVNPQGREDNLIKQGITPSKLTIQEEGTVSEKLIFPWATIKKGKLKTNVNLLKSSYSDTQEAQIKNSIQNLEFAFTEAIYRVTTPKRKKIAILKGNGELTDIYQYDWLKSLGKNYHLAPFTLDSIASAPQKTTKELQAYDLAIITKPEIAFSEKEKYALDQFTMNGGKSIWLLDMVTAPKDSLMQNGKVLAYQKDLNLTDYLFNYGVRFNKHLVRDLYAAKITLAVGNIGNKTQFDNFLWDFYPVLKTNNQHVINQNLGEIKLEFANTLDTLNKSIKKTVLLNSSKLTKTMQVPNYVELTSITESKTPNQYNEGAKITGVLLEGNLKSAYRNRVKPFKTNHLQSTNNGKMIVIADGDISTNQISKGKPMELGLDKWTNTYYANKEFLMNSVNYLLDDTGLIELRSKTITLNTINRPKASQEKVKWQFINIILPLFLTLLLALINTVIRKKKNVL
ncbi:gliding motility-associated ABC transporter substrate-binding protein GldG [Flavobacteriaceae bacterium]|nr:gliding motility-associated ABC transporter substrate-binding protein GldG [Flavobacteriaceae bacterium]